MIHRPLIVTTHSANWDPDSPTSSDDRVALYDELRQRCPVAYSDGLGWSLFKHADVMRALHEPCVFSNVVSTHVSVPNGMDPPQHTAYRSLIDPYFAPERMAALEPQLRLIGRALIDALPTGGELDVMLELADEYSLQAQCAFLSWSAELHRPLRAWVKKNHEATRRRDRAAASALAFEFDRHIRAVLDASRSDASATDVTAQLRSDRVAGRRLTDDELVSILRNWTVGELATLSASIGIVINFLAEHTDVQARLRAEQPLLPAAIEEMLRLEAPLLTSRRVATNSVQIGGRTLDAGERVTLMWSAANRDAEAFVEPARFELDRDPAGNLLFGAGIHVCPGAPLARLELRVLMEELLDALEIHPIAGKAPRRARYPAGGFSQCPVRITKQRRC